MRKEGSESEKGKGREKWDIVNRERRGRKGINEGIEMEEWREYFMGLLGGQSSQGVREKDGERRRRG